MTDCVTNCPKFSLRCCISGKQEMLWGKSEPVLMHGGESLREDRFRITDGIDYILLKFILDVVHRL